MFNIKDIRKDFPMLNNKKMQNHDLIYFDNGATTFKPQCVIDAVVNYYNNYSTNAHRGDYELSFYVDKNYEETRKDIAKFINANDNEIVYTSGASNALNLAANILKDNIKEGDIILSTVAEHASSVLPWLSIAKDKNAIVEYIQLDETGKISIEDLKSKLNDKVKVVAIAQVSNVLGVINPIKEITTLAKQYNAYVIVDAAQSAPHIKIDVKDLGIDFLAFSAHKMCGPTGVGVLYGKYELLENGTPLILGGGSNTTFEMCGDYSLKPAPHKYEAGTPAIEGILGFKEAIKYLSNIGLDEIHEYESNLRKYAIDKLKQLDNIIIYNEYSDTGVITFNIKDVFAQDAGTYYSSKGIAIRSGNHCAKMLKEYIGTNATLRATFYFYNTKEEVDYFIEVSKNLNKDTYLDVFF